VRVDVDGIGLGPCPVSEFGVSSVLSIPYGFW
jgi:hypothetical protein